ncbi:MAG TPA: hypothetical protein VK203_19210 [Nostocaceae cyanobacterium]|nr:hypothetical protein [Nostocaceae cyanobacterium]
MKNYLDPVHLIVNETTWKSRIYANIFNSLTQSLEYIEEVEKDSNSLYKLVKFKFSQELFGAIYNHNPFKNDPTIGTFYVNIFSKVLSDLTRRFDWCPTRCEIQEDKLTSIFSCESDYLPDEVLPIWEALINQCAVCSLQESLIFLSPSGFETQIKSEHQVVQQTSSVYALFSVSFFLQKDIISDDSLRKAIEIFYHQSVVSGRMEANLQPQEYIFDQNFWKTLDSAKLCEEDTEYRERFVNSLTQVIYAKDIDIRIHKYGKIAIDRKKYDQYSADVFKMGRGSNDNRCSRIFYCKIKNQICFYEFDPDFHAGE